MNALWQSGAATVQQVQSRLTTTPPLAYNTVQTVLTILHRKRYVRRRMVGKAHLYEVAVTRERTARNALGELIDNLFGGSAIELAMAIVGSDRLTRSDLRRIAALIRKHERESR